MTESASAFQRLILPGLAFKAVVIGGGYATGRELVEFFLPSGPRGGLLAMGVAMVIWSIVCTLTFLLARQYRAFDYRSFFKVLLGRAWWLFEVAYALLFALILAVFGAAAGEIGRSLFGLPLLAGTILLMIGTALATTFGNTAVERVFKYVSFFLYAVYALFIVLALSSFSASIVERFSSSSVTGHGWTTAGVAYAGYNVLGAVLILPVVRHMVSARDAVVAGVLCGPLAMLPAMMFFISMCAFYPEIGDVALPSAYVLERMQWPGFQFIFQLMVFAALLESGAGCVNAVNERVAGMRPGRDSKLVRFTIAFALMLVCMFVARQVGLVALIANGYRIASVAVVVLFVLPLILRALVSRPASLADMR